MDGPIFEENSEPFEKHLWYFNLIQQDGSKSQ